jgi:hypothetical protein
MVTVESETVERELKFEADSVQVEDLPGEPVGERLFDSVYFDTEGGLLLTAEITLRRRTEEGRTVAAQAAQIGRTARTRGTRGTCRPA